MKSEECLKQFCFEYQFQLDKESVKHYLCAIKQLIEYTGRNFDVITKRDIRQWLGYLAEIGYKPWTIHSKLTGLKTFYRYCMEEGFVSTNPAAKIPFPAQEDKLPYYLNLKQLSQLRELVNGRLPEERVIIEVLYATGIRISELSAMKKEDIYWTGRMIKIPKGKRKKGRIVPFTRKCEIHLKAYLETRPNGTPYVFIGPRNKDRPIHPDTVGQWFRAYARELGFRVTPHALHHTFAANLAKRGMPIHCIQTLLGHEEPKQTRLYARLYSDARKEMYDEYM